MKQFSQALIARMIDEADCVIELRDGRVVAEKRNAAVGDHESQ